MSFDLVLFGGTGDLTWRKLMPALFQAFRHGKLPVFYGAQAYDSILLIDSAVRAVKGDLKDVKGMVAAMRKANFNSLRGPFQYNVNHHPIQNFYLLKTEKAANGDIEMHIQKTIFEKHKDSYYQDCKMKW